MNKQMNPTKSNLKGRWKRKNQMVKSVESTDKNYNDTSLDNSNQNDINQTSKSNRESLQNNDFRSEKISDFESYSPAGNNNEKRKNFDFKNKRRNFSNQNERGDYQKRHFEKRNEKKSNCNTNFDKPYFCSMNEDSENESKKCILSRIISFIKNIFKSKKKVYEFKKHQNFKGKRYYNKNRTRN